MSSRNLSCLDWSGSGLPKGKIERERGLVVHACLGAATDRRHGGTGTWLIQHVRYIHTLHSTNYSQIVSLDLQIKTRIQFVSSMMLSKTVRVRMISQSNKSAGYESEVYTVSGTETSLPEYLPAATRAADSPGDTSTDRAWYGALLGHQPNSTPSPCHQAQFA